MMAYIGSKISLISKSDIRYVGTLIEINQEQSTVSLQDVQSWGTEGRRGNPSEELPPSDEAYPYVVFRGSDVKDLHVMTAPERPPPAPMRVPNDPAVIRSGGPTPGSSSGPTPAGPPPDPSGPPRPPGFQGYGGGPGGMMGQPGQYPGMPGSHPYGMPPQPMGFGYPPPPPHMLPQKQPYWGPQGDQQRPPSGYPGSMQGPGSQMGGQPLPQQQAQEVSPVTRETPVGQTQSSKVASSDETDLVQNFDTLDLNESAVLPGDRPTREPGQKAKPTGPQRADADRGAGRTTARRPQQGMAEQVDRPTLAAKKEDAVETKQPEEKAAETGAAQPSEKDLNAEASVRNENMRLPGTGAHLLNSGPRRGRGRGRGGSSGQMRNNRITVPDSDFDFEIANAKFNKTELANEASTSTSTAAAPKPVHVSPTADVVAPTNDGYEPEEEEHEDDEGFYQKSSFFDNISCESKDRADSGDGRGTRRVRQYEERRLNLETFGQMGVDGGRGGYRRGGYGGGYRRGGNNSGRGRGGYGGGYNSGGYNQGGYGGHGHGQQSNGYGNQGHYQQRDGNAGRYDGNRDRGYGRRENGYGGNGYQAQQQQQQQQFPQ
ncbi:Scd6-like Sm domain-containing protein [Powellomyces hirtus]|nr:Scd6-like Sm domain-containing protein [Powellomyces hirtus]